MLIACCLLYWTGLNWFMSCLDKSKCTVYSIFDQTSQKGIFRAYCPNMCFVMKIKFGKRQPSYVLFWCVLMWLLPPLLWLRQDRFPSWISRSLSAVQYTETLESVQIFHCKLGIQTYIKLWLEKNGFNQDGQKEGCRSHATVKWSKNSSGRHYTYNSQICLW